jgi:uncharacterized protein
MNHEQAETFIEKHKILEVEVGSFVYGTNIETSDRDYSGIIICPKEYYIGLESLDEIDMSIISKTESGKNDKDAIDSKFYNITKFIKLAMENNPNILEQLFTPQFNIKFITNLGKKLIDNRELFPHIGLKQKFLGYAFSQKHKMMIKVDNYTGLKQFDEWLDNFVVNPRQQEKFHDSYYSNQLLVELRNVKYVSSFVKFNEHNALIGDINISLTEKLSKVHSKVKDRLSKVGNREELYTKYGYDVKFGMHLVRLMLEGKELLDTGKLEYPLKDKDLLLDIRSGKWTREDIIQYSEQLGHEIEFIISPLPNKPQYDKIGKLLVDIIEEHWYTLKEM